MATVSGLLKKPMTQNFTALVLLQGVNYLLPLLTYPYLFRVLQPEMFGLIAFGYAFMQYFVMLTDFGFNLSATRYISIHRNHPDVINRYLNSALVCRFVLAVAGFLILLALTASFNKFREEPVFYLSYFGMVIGNVLFPMWYFQGMENMKYITIVNIVAKTVSCIPFFIFIRQPQDYTLVPFFYSAGFILAGIVSVYIIYFKEKMKWFVPAFKEIRFAFTDSFTYFLSRTSLYLYSNINALVIGLVCGNAAVGYYSAAEKLYQAYNQLLIPFTGVLFPHIAKTGDVPFFKRVFKRITPANIALLAGVLFFSAWIIRIVYGSAAQEGSLNVFRILMCGCVATIPSMLLGYPFLAAMGHAGYTNWTVVIAALFHITGLLVLFAAGCFSIYAVAAMVVLTESFLLILRIRGVFKYKLV
ncbi:MAG: oligosaccharide flippase family protein [Bacteroidales bacterium]